MTDPESYVSPYLLRPCRSLTQARREIEERAWSAHNPGRHSDDQGERDGQRT